MRDSLECVEVEVEVGGLGQIGSLAKHDCQWMCTRTLAREQYLRRGSKCRQIYIYNVVSDGVMRTRESGAGRLTEWVL